MKKLKVTYKVPGTIVTSAAVEDHGTGANRRELALMNGDAEINLKAGKYVLRWRARGAPPSTEYTIEITAPEEAKWKPDPPKKSTPTGNIRAQRTFTIDS